jgi:hypothetical protein
MKQLHEMNSIPEILQEIQKYVDEIKRLQLIDTLQRMKQDDLIISFNDIQKIISELMDRQMAIETMAQRKGIQFKGNYPNIQVQIIKDISEYKK